MNKYLIPLYIVFVGFIIGCSSEIGDQEKEKFDQAETLVDISTQFISLKKADLEEMDISFMPIEERIIYPTVFASGTVAPKPNHEASVTPRITGVVENIFVLEGSNVKKGQPLMSISSLELIQIQQDYLAALTDANFYKNEYIRQTTLRSQNVGALSEYQQVESKYLSAISLEKTLRETLKIQGIDPEDLQDPANAKIKTVKILKSPIEGFIRSLPAKLGMRAEPSSVLAEIIDLSELRADVYCYEKDLALIRENQTVEIQFIDKTIPKAKGKIDYVSRSIDKETRSVVMYISFIAPKGYLVMPEMAITAKIKTLNSGKKAKTVMQSAVYEEDGQDYIFFNNPSKDSSGTVMIRKARIKKSNTDGDYIEINFDDPVPDDALIAVSNVSNLENEFKKLEGKKD